MEIDEIYQNFIKLKENTSPKNNYIAVPIIKGKPHRLGISPEGYPMFFVECSDDLHFEDIKLELIKVLFHRQCSLITNENKIPEKKIFTIILLKSEREDLQEYFLQVILLVLMRLKGTPKTITLKTEIYKVIELFINPPTVSEETVRGLWAELFSILMGKDIPYLVESWHSTAYDKYDFNDQIDLLEVKSATGDHRSHIFSIEQLNPAEGKVLFIASVFVNHSGQGTSILDLMDMLTSSLLDDDLSIKVTELVLKTLGVEYDKVKDIQFDFNYAKQTYKIFDSLDIPKIEPDAVPARVSNVKFRSDLSEVKSIEENGRTYTGKMYKCL